MVRTEGERTRPANTTAELITVESVPSTSAFAPWGLRGELLIGLPSEPRDDVRRPRASWQGYIYGNCPKLIASVA